MTFNWSYYIFLELP